MSDLISRKAAIDAIRASTSKYMGFMEMEMYTDDDAVEAIEGLPSAQPEIIRCKDCKYYEIGWLKADGSDDKRYKPSVCVNGKYSINRKPDWFCADAERKENG